MRNRSWPIGIGTFALLGGFLMGMQAESGPRVATANGSAKDGTGTAPAVAVVELFTSEGCSSCPPADVLLAEIIQEARKQNRPVFGLAFHVDYWNRLGWTDPFSDAAFSRRQHEYAKAFKSDQVYTPQMIVNGSAELVGSDRARARAGIDAALKRPAKASVKLHPEKAADRDVLPFAYEVTGAPRGAVLNVALVERGLVTKVNRGENAGRTLRHENVVRRFQTRSLDNSAKGTVEFKPPADLVRQNASVIAYVQEANLRTVLGAAAVDLEPGASR
jgi:hypothetical protein